MSKRQRGVVCRLFLAPLLLASSVSLAGQTITGTIRGTVQDATGASIVGATVIARNVETGVKTTVKTDKTGSYRVVSLPIGQYEVIVSKDGFNEASTKPMSLEIDQTARMDVKLVPGSVTTTIEVASDNGTVLQTENATLGTTITANMLQQMPLSGQNFSTATVFVPGAVLPTYSALGGANGTERDTTASTLPSFNGNRQQTNNYIFDGADINETMNNVVGYNPAPESLEQIRVITANADAEYGNVNGGEVIMVTKSGTNKFHGSVYSFYENQDLTANLWSNNYNRISKGKFHQNQFGASLGGPIMKNRLFFYADFEGFRNSAAGTGLASVPTAYMRTGDFSEFLGGHSSGVPLSSQIQLYDTTSGLNTATPYANNQIPIVNPVAKYLFTHPEIYPLPNRGSSVTTSPDSQNYSAPTKTIIVNNQGDVRGDYVIGARDAMNMRFSMGDAWDATPKPVLAVTFPAGNEYPFIGGVINEVHTFSSTLQNQFRAGISRIGWKQGLPVDSTGEFGTDGDAKLGLPFPNQPYAGFTQVNLSSVESNVGTRGAATKYFDNIFSYGDDATWQLHKHNLKAGVLVLRYQQNSYYPSTYGAMGYFSYTGSYTADSLASKTGAPRTTGYGFADFALDKSSAQAVAGVSGLVGHRQYRTAYYVQDDWHLLPNLTVNIGLRYAYDQPIYEVNNKEVNVDTDNPAKCPACLEFAGQNGNSRALYSPYYKEFMPRLGVNYQLNPTVIFRAGYGITDDLEGTGANLRMTQNAPFIYQFYNTNLTPTSTSGGNPSPVENGFSTGTSNVSTSSTIYRAWAHNLRPALIQQYNLATEVLLTHTLTFQLGYVGETGQHLIVPVRANQYTTPGVASTAPYAALVGTGGTIYLTQSEGNSNYNAMQLQIRQRQTHGLEFTFNYTWARAMTNNPGFYGVTGVDGAGVFQQNIYDPHSDYGPAATDARNSVNFVGTYSLPFGHGRDFGARWSRWLDEPLGGWKLSANAVMYSGFPVTITATNVANANNGSARANQYRPLIVVNRSLNHWFGTDASAQPCSGSDNGTCAYDVEHTNTYGTAHVGTERAPGYRIIDMSFFKDFRTYKEQSLTFRLDAFNAFNLASYAAPGASVSTASTFGLITSTLSPARQFQFAAKYRF
ncbi:TonB-dependent receptor domain-containing protein [Granulicella cerasi]|uniref:TonB-dependent receptor domain-containing protein n=1 Tax=Granulicella cerasi TaxID=741063 RepID=A0ABW1Z3M7_9BACT|nr:TonB-dependent receptor [Granulicella cerasi]